MKKISMIAAVAFLVMVVVAEAQDKTPPRPPWVVVERKSIHDVRDGVPQYSIRGRTLWGQRWTIFTHSTSDFESVSPGLVYRCYEEWDGDRWCPDGMVEGMLTIHLPEVYKTQERD